MLPKENAACFLFRKFFIVGLNFKRAMQADEPAPLSDFQKRVPEGMQTGE